MNVVAQSMNPYIVQKFREFHLVEWKEMYPLPDSIAKVEDIVLEKMCIKYTAI